MIRQLNSVQKSSHIALGRNRNFIVHGFPEPFINEGNQREMAMRHHEVNLLLTVEIPEHVVIKRVF